MMKAPIKISYKNSKIYFIILALFANMWIASISQGGDEPEKAPDLKEFIMSILNKNHNLTLEEEISKKIYFSLIVGENITYDFLIDELRGWISKIYYRQGLVGDISCGYRFRDFDAYSHAEEIRVLDQPILYVVLETLDGNTIQIMFGNIDIEKMELLFQKQSKITRKEMESHLALNTVGQPIRTCHSPGKDILFVEANPDQEVILQGLIGEHNILIFLDKTSEKGFKGFALSESAFKAFKDTGNFIFDADFDLEKTKLKDKRESLLQAIREYKLENSKNYSIAASLEANNVPERCRFQKIGLSFKERLDLVTEIELNGISLKMITECLKYNIKAIYYRQGLIGDRIEQGKKTDDHDWFRFSNEIRQRSENILCIIVEFKDDSYFSFLTGSDTYSIEKLFPNDIRIKDVSLRNIVTFNTGSDHPCAVSGGPLRNVKFVEASETAIQILLEEIGKNEIVPFCNFSIDRDAWKKGFFKPIKKEGG